jgi:hypothetical protein
MSEGLELHLPDSSNEVFLLIGNPFKMLPSFLIKKPFLLCINGTGSRIVSHNDD